MEFLERTLNRVFKGLTAGISLAAQKDGLIRLEFAPGSAPLVELAAERGLPDSSAMDALENAYGSSVSILNEFFADASRESRARIDVLMGIASRMGYFCFAGDDGRIYLAAPAGLEWDLRGDLERLDAFFRRDFGVGLKWAACAPEEGIALVEKRVGLAREFFIRSKGPWIQKFMDTLQDDLSRDSLQTYLRQRILAKIFWDGDICYPVEPPASTATWRKEREMGTYAYPVLKNMQGKAIDNIHYKYVYVYEQYGLPGIVEVEPGDTVIDAGAFVGDSAVYFSRKAGPEGRIYAFEIFPDSVACGRENMEANGITNVEYVNAALSDKKGKAKILIGKNSISQSKILFNIDDTSDTIDTLTIDAFRRHCGPVRFIKADIEGSEMAMLRGARETILQDGPTCALCVYHKRDDFWEIPEFLSALRPDYKFWFRCEAEPVLFARCCA